MDLYSASYTQYYKPQDFPATIPQQVVIQKNIQSLLPLENSFIVNLCARCTILYIKTMMMYQDL